MNLDEHPTVRRFRDSDRPDNAEPPKPLDAAWLRQLCLDCGADDAGLVETSPSGPGRSAGRHPPLLPARPDAPQLRLPHEPGADP